MKPDNPTFLNPAQVQHFHRYGYLNPPAEVSATTLKRMQQFAADLLIHPPADAARVNTSGQDYTIGIGELYARGNLDALWWLGSPELLHVACAICGPDPFPVQQFMVIKNTGDETVVQWHRDAPSEHEGPTCMIALYLDDAHAGDGALRVVPGSHTNPRDICAVQHEPFTELPAQAGTLLAHHLRLAHSSTPLHHHAQRRVLYTEFMPAGRTQATGFYSSELVTLHTRLLSLAVAWHRQQHPDARTPQLPHLQEFAYGPGTDYRHEVETIRARAIRPQAALYCFGQGS